MSGSALDRLARRMGIVEVYRDFDGVERHAGPETKIALLAAMGCAVSGEASAAEALAGAQADDARRLAPREVVARAGAAVEVPVRGAVDWRLVLENGGSHSGRGEGAICLPPAPMGCHLLEIEGGGRAEAVPVILAPAGVPQVADLTGAPKAWGVMAALYGLRSARNLGVGDYADLGMAAEAFGRAGAAFVGINPVHALGAGAPELFSPYSPTHREFLNTAHIAVDQVPEFRHCAAARAVLDANADVVAAAGEAPLVDYAAVAPVRAEALERLFDCFEHSPRAAEFARWLAERGRPLADFATFEAISETHGADWRAWPAGLRDRASPEVAAFARTHARRVRFHGWIQWLADCQLGAAQARAKAAGMRLGLYLDLAVGARPGGAEVWANPEALAGGVSLGAPPDALGPDGQNWGLAPFSPPGLQRTRYAPFIALLRAVMRHAGILRIDHALGLGRSFWIPEGGGPGGYVRYPMETLLAIIAIEARRAGTLVIGEDLGLVPPDFRDRLAGAGLYGCAVMQFEREGDGSFRDPATYRAKSLASFGTHDTPTLRGFCAGRDLDWYTRMGRMGDEHAARAHRAHLVEGLRRLCRPWERGEDDITADAMHARLADAGSELVAVQLDDILGEVEQQNMPGTIDEHPNWRRRAAVPVDALAGDPRLKAASEIMAGRDRAPAPQEEATE